MRGPTSRALAALRSRWRLILGFGISAVFLYLVVRNLRWAEFGAFLREANYFWLLPGVAVYFLGVVARTWRWHFMLRRLRPVPFYQLFRLQAIGYMGNNVYPARAGEVLRSVVLKRETGISVSASLATVFIERLFDGLVMLLFVFAALPFVTLESKELDLFRPLIAFFTVAFLGALVVFLWLASDPARARRIYERLGERLVPAELQPRVGAVVDRFMLGLESLGHGTDVALIFFATILVWLCETAKYWFVMHAFPFTVSFVTLMLMNGVVNLATTLPAAPGYAGTFDWPGIKILEAAGVNTAVATAYTSVLHLALWLPITLLGAFYLWRSHIDVQQARREVSEAESAGTAG